jgi:hypothetical protein
MKEHSSGTNCYLGFHLMKAAYETLEIKLCYVAKERTSLLGLRVKFQSLS